MSIHRASVSHSRMISTPPARSTKVRVQETPKRTVSDESFGGKYKTTNDIYKSRPDCLTGAKAEKLYE